MHEPDPSSPAISVEELRKSLQRADAPVVIDVRRVPAFREGSQMIRGAVRRDPAHVTEWSGSLPRGSHVVVYCVRGHEVGKEAARALNAAGVATRFLDGGLESWVAAGGETDAKPASGATRWVTRERPKIDRIACPWLVRRFVDPDAEFLYVPSDRVRQVAAEQDAIAYDVPGVHFTHEGERCSFDAFVRHYGLRDPALEELALIVRAADTGRLELAPQAAGLVAISLGLSRNFARDHQMLEHGLVIYDALYTWCKEGKDEAHTWKPATHPAAAGALS
jgi:rhodanese-related sulfurtransferase